MTSKDDNELKSSFDLAMEQFGGGEKTHLTEDQKAAIAAINERMRASIAETEIMMDQKILEASQGGDQGKTAELEAQKTMVIQKTRDDAEDEKETVRRG